MIPSVTNKVLIGLRKQWPRICIYQASVRFLCNSVYPWFTCRRKNDFWTKHQSFGGTVHTFIDGNNIFLEAKILMIPVFLLKFITFWLFKI